MIHLAGATVRGLYRKRAARREERLRAKQEGRLPRISDRRERELIVGQGQPSVGHCASGLPFSMARILQVDGGGDVVVLDGRALKITSRLPWPGEEWVEIQRCRRAVEPLGQVGSRIAGATARHERQVGAWVRALRSEDAVPELDLETQPANRRMCQRITAFVEDALIPRLDEEGCDWARADPCDDFDPGVPDIDRKAPSRSGVPQTPAFHGEIGAAVCRRERLDCLALYTQSCHRLVPYFGRPRGGQFHLCHGNRQYVGVSRENRFRTTERWDATLRSTILDLFPQISGAPEATPDQEVIYDNGTYTIVRSHGGYYYCCRLIPAYTVEGRDRRLYRFEEVRVGVCVSDTDVRQVIRYGAARIMHAYDHIFTFSDGKGASICMPRPDSFYRSLHKMPLSEAILNYLEAARMTLCAGHFDGSGHSPYSTLETHSRPRITEAQARQQGMPVYPYFRERAQRPGRKCRRLS